MKKLKCILAVVAVLTTATLSTLSVGATDYSYDVNNDGIISNADMLLLTRYLAGLYDVTDLASLDVNNNHVVDVVDLDCLSARLIGASITFSNSIAGTNAVTSTETRQYYKKINGSTAAPTTYTLSQSVTENASVEPASVTPVTGTYTSCETGIVKIIMNDSGFGTGFIVGDNIIATDAHCVYGSSGFYDVDVILFDEDGDPTQTLSADELHIPVQYTTYSTGNAAYDYALIYVEEDLSDYPHFELGTVLADTVLRDNVEVELTGFPVTANGSTMNSTTMHNLCTTDRTVYYINSVNGVDDSVVIFQDVDSEIVNGFSGSPFYTTTSYSVGSTSYTRFTAISMVRGPQSSNDAQGVRFTAPVIQFYKSNDYIG